MQATQAKAPTTGGVCHCCLFCNGKGYTDKGEDEQREIFNLLKVGVIGRNVPANKLLLVGTLFRPISSYWPEQFRPIRGYWSERSGQ